MTQPTPWARAWARYCICIRAAAGHGFRGFVVDAPQARAIFEQLERARRAREHD